MMQSKFSSHFSPHSPQTLEAEFYQITQQKEAQKRDSGSLSVKASLFNFLKTIGSQLVCFLTGTQTLSIRSKRLKNGTVQWTVFDPNTGRCYRFDSETAVRSWLEQQHCR